VALYLSLLISLPKCEVDPTHSRVARGELIAQYGDRTLDKRVAMSIKFV